MTDNRMIHDPRQFDLIDHIRGYVTPTVVVLPAHDHTNYYDCCGMYWEREGEEWERDECSKCHREIGPYESEEIS